MILYFLADEVTDRNVSNWMWLCEHWLLLVLFSRYVREGKWGECKQLLSFIYLFWWLSLFIL